MTNRFIISDTHFGHTNSWEKFKRPDGSPLRPFTSNEEMDDAMVERWNAKVKTGDTVYHLGDVVIARRNLETVKRLNGRKILIRGNHDLFRDKDYYDAGFESLRGCHVFSGQFIFTHIPIHPESIARFRVNVHGHLHANEVMRDVENISEMNTFGGGIFYDRKPDPRYLCVSVEHTNYEPLSFDEVEARIQKRFTEFGYVPPSDPWGNGSGPG